MRAAFLRTHGLARFPIVPAEFVNRGDGGSIYERCKAGRGRRTSRALRSGSGVGGDRPAVAAAMNGNLCRCTGYVSLLDALTEILGSQ